MIILNKVNNKNNNNEVGVGHTFLFFVSSPIHRNNPCKTGVGKRVIMKKE
jgi:hypothetical protein